jgi:hypothetical protein
MFLPFATRILAHSMEIFVQCALESFDDLDLEQFVSNIHVALLPP